MRMVRSPCSVVPWLSVITLYPYMRDHDGYQALRKVERQTLPALIYQEGVLWLRVLFIARS
jgi:hypothetical protein